MEKNNEASGIDGKQAVRPENKLMVDKFENMNVFNQIYLIDLEHKQKTKTRPKEEKQFLATSTREEE